jgi:hypothetical protein
LNKETAVVNTYTANSTEQSQRSSRAVHQLKQWVYMPVVAVPHPRPWQQLACNHLPGDLAFIPVPSYSLLLIS